MRNMPSMSARQQSDIAAFLRDERLSIPAEFDYSGPGCPTRLVKRFASIRPEFDRSAQRTEGITPRAAASPDSAEAVGAAYGGHNPGRHNAAARQRSASCRRARAADKASEDSQCPRRGRETRPRRSLGSFHVKQCAALERVCRADPALASGQKEPRCAVDAGRHLETRHIPRLRRSSCRFSARFAMLRRFRQRSGVARIGRGDFPAQAQRPELSDLVEKQWPEGSVSRRSDSDPPRSARPRCIPFVIDR